MIRNPSSWLEDLRVAAPCPADWDQMQGDDRCRHCSQCDLQVFDLSAMTRPEAERLVRDRLGVPGGARLCVRFTRRADGTVLTRECPVGMRQRLRRARTRLAAACAALLAFAGCRKLAVEGDGAPPDAPTDGVHAVDHQQGTQPDPVVLGSVRVMGEIEPMFPDPPAEGGGARSPR